jgi:hypothetical protein
MPVLLMALSAAHSIRPSTIESILNLSHPENHLTRATILNLTHTRSLIPPACHPTSSSMWPTDQSLIHLELSNPSLLLVLCFLDARLDGLAFPPSLRAHRFFSFQF